MPENALQTILEQLRQSQEVLEEGLKDVPRPGQGGTFTGEKKEPYSSVRKKEEDKRLQKEMERIRRKGLRKKKHYMVRRMDYRRKYRRRAEKILSERMATPENQWKAYRKKYGPDWDISLEDWLDIIQRTGPTGEVIWKEFYAIRRHESTSKYCTTNIYIVDSTTRQVLYCSKEEELYKLGYCTR